MAVYKRGKVWYMDFVLRGQRVCKSTGKYTKRDALMVEAKERMLLDQELSQVRKPEMRLSDAIERCYLETWTHNKDGERAYKRAYMVMEALGGDLPISKITKAEIEEAKSYLLKLGQSKATVNRHLASLKTVLNHAQKDWEVLDSVPKIKLFKESSGRIRVINPEELNIIVAKMNSYGVPKIGHLISVLYDTGMRLGEALALKYSWVDYDQGIISIWDHIKNDKPRSIPMTERVRAALKTMEKNYKTGEYIFPLSENSIHHYWKRVRRDMNLEDDKGFVVHALRHTCASRLVQAEVPLYTVAELLGHSSIQVTQRYAHLAPKNLKTAIKTLELGQ